MSSENAKLPPDVADAARDPARRFGSDGRYVLLDELGTGGAGRVFKAFDTLLARYVALKGLYRLDPDSLARFRREAALAARLRHPGIVAVHDFGDHDGQPYLVMDLVEGAPLHRASLDTRGKVTALRDAARAVHCAHAQGILHRDLKPSNLMIDPSGRTLVMDFGLAREVKAADDPRSGLTLTGDVLGTPQYMSPEQAQGGARNLDGRTDVYGLGATLYHLLTGRFPHDGATAFEVLTSVVTRDPPPPGADPDLDKIVMKAMEKDRARRYDTAEALADDLDRWLRGEPVLATRPSVTYRLRKRLHRNPWAWGVGLGLGAAVVAVAALGIAALVREKAAASRRDQARTLALEAGAAFGLERLDQARERVEQALALNPEDAFARYWRARLRLREYENRRPLPAARIMEGYVTFAPATAESSEATELRRSVEEVFAAFAEESGERHLGRAVLAISDDRLEDALAEIALAEEGLLPGWDLPYYRVLALYLAGRFVEARDAARLHAFAEHPALPARALGLRVDLAASLGDQLHGATPDWEPLSRRARALRDLGLRAQVLLAGARWKREHGQMADEEIAAAIEVVEPLDEPDAALARGEALRERALGAAAIGQVHPDDPRLFLAAVDALTEGARRFPLDPVLLARRAEVWRELALWKIDRFGRLGPDELTSARDDYAAALAAGLQGPEILLGRVEMDFRLAPKRTPEARRGAYETWVQQLGEIARDFASFPPVWVRLGGAWDALGRERTLAGGDADAAFDEAAAAYGRAIDLNPEYAAAFRGLGAARIDQGVFRYRRGRAPDDVFDAGFAALDRAIEIDRASAENLIARGLGRQNRAAIAIQGHQDPTGDLRAAIADGEQALGINPQSADAWHIQGSAWINLGFYHLETDPEEALGDLERGIEAAGRALALNPWLSDAIRMQGMALVHRGEILTRLGRNPVEAYRNAAEVLTSAIESQPEASWYVLERGMAYEGWAKYVRSLSQDPTEPLTAAVADFRRFTEMTPDDPEGWTRLAFALLNYGRVKISLREDHRAVTEDALAAATKLTEMTPDSGIAWFYRGAALNDLGRAEEARAAFEAAVERDPSLRGPIERALRTGGEEF